MSSDIGTKINHLLKTWPVGTIATASWLESQGVYHQLVAHYEHSAWIKRIGHGAFARDGDEVEWKGALFAIQTQLNLPIIAGGKTALELQGVSHFVSSGSGNFVYLFGTPRSRLPTWFQQHDWKAKIHFAPMNLFLDNTALGITDKIIGKFSIKLSTRERAILELLSLVPKSQEFDEAKLLFEGLRTLRPDLLQQLLEKCNSIKAKRIFLHLADTTNQPWFKDLDLAKIDLGKGKRMIGKGGSFDSKYNISVPKVSGGENQTEVDGA